MEVAGSGFAALSVTPSLSHSSQVAAVPSVSPLGDTTSQTHAPSTLTPPASISGHSLPLPSSGETLARNGTASVASLPTSSQLRPRHFCGASSGR